MGLARFGHHRSRTTTAVAILMTIEAASLAVASALHLTGVVHGRSATFDPNAAGIAEAVIGAVLATAAVVMLRSRSARATTTGIGATTFALFGFAIGISATLAGGDAPDIAYHASVIPLLVAGMTLLLRARRHDVPDTRAAKRRSYYGRSDQPGQD
jgi:membrane associated rhomboid family serine protease